MAGHSHWAGIKHKKALVDAKRGKLFSKLAKQIITAAKNGGGDPEANLKLKYAIDKAKAANMPNDNIDRAVKRGTGELDGAQFEEIVYEGYAPGGVAILLEVLTDNRNRTVGEIRNLFDRRGGKMGDSGCVSYLFEKRSYFRIPIEGQNEEELLELALDLGADNLEEREDHFELVGAPESFDAIRSGLIAKEIPVEASELMMLPSSTVPITEVSAGKKVIALLEAFEEHDDVQNAYANFDLTEDVLNALREEA